MNEVSVSQQLARRDRHFLHAGNNPERANAAQAPAPLGANLRFDPFPAKRAPDVAGASRGRAGQNQRANHWPDGEQGFLDMLIAEQETFQGVSSRIYFKLFDVSIYNSPPLTKVH